ncbi:MAG: hypothetical protein WBC44_11605 [Planctomycetaceae bacterium]
MPRLPAPLDPVVELAMAQWAEYKNRDHWQRSRRGNLYRHWDGATVTIFKRSDGWYGWCVSDTDGTQFSRGGYATKADAIHAAGEDSLYIGQF